MQHASGLMAVDDGSGIGGGKSRKTAYTYMADDEENKEDGLKTHAVVA